MKGCVNKYELNHIFEHMDYLPQEKLRKLTENSDVILLWKFGLGITTKLYEGVALGKIFLATCEHEEIIELIRRFCPNSITCKPTGGKAIISAIRRLYQMWSSGNLADVSSEAYLQEYSWLSRTKSLANVIGKVTNANP